LGKNSSLVTMFEVWDYLYIACVTELCTWYTHSHSS